MSAARAPSIRRLLVGALILVIGLATALTAALGYREARIEAGELFDAKLAHSARVLAGLVGPSLRDGGAAASRGPLRIDLWQGQVDGEGEVLATPTGHAYETKLAFQVRDAAGNLLLLSANAPAAPLSPLRGGFADTVRDDGPWRIFTLREAAGLWIQTGESAAIRDELARDIALDTVLPLLVALPILALLIWAIVGWGCRPLTRVAADVGARAADRLDPVPDRGVPRELAALVDAINGLLVRLRGALEHAHRFTADAAHELRTPLAALKVHVANLGAASSAEMRLASQRQVERAVQRLERLVAQLLLLSRFDPGGVLPARRPVALRPLAVRIVGDCAPEAVERDQDLALEAGDVAPVALGDETALGIVLRNLVENAVRYTPPAGHIRVALAAEPGRVAIRVEDSGPGIPEAARERVFARFHRELGQEADGSGLGLSIVQRIVALHGGTVRLDASRALGGLAVTVELPAA